MSLIHFIVLKPQNGCLLLDEINSKRAQLADVQPGEDVRIRISGHMSHFQPGVGELLGRWLAQAGNVELNGGGFTRRQLWESMNAAAWQESHPGAQQAGT